MPVGMDYSAFKAEFDKDPIGMLRAGGKKQMNFSQYSNSICPSPLLEDRRSVLSLVTQDMGLFTRSSDISLASTVEEFADTPQGEVIMHDLLFRAYTNKRNSLTSGFEDSLGSVLRPGDGSEPRVDTQVAPAININELVAMTTPIRTQDYRPFRWIYSADALERKEIAPGAPVPATTLGQKEDTIQLKKWGNRFELTYESLRNYDVRIDKLAQMIQLEGLREQARMLDELVGVFEKGDTTKDSAATIVKQSVLDSAATNGELSAKAWLAFGMEYDAPYIMTHALMRKANSLQLILLTLGNANLQVSQLINAQAEGIPRIEQMNVTADAVRFGRVPDSAITEHYIVGLDSRFSVEMVQQTGAEMQEQADNIENQVRNVVLTNTYGWAKLDHSATKVLNVNA